MDEPLEVHMDDAAIRFLPHREPAHLIRRAIDSTTRQLRCLARYPAENAMVRDGEVPTYLTVEAAAQAAATHLALLAINDGQSISHFEGYLTGFKQMKITRQSVPANTEFQVLVKLRGGARGMYKYLFEVEYDGAVVSTGELTTFVQPVEE